MSSAVIAGYARSPFHVAGKGALACLRPDDLAAQVVRGLLERTKVDPLDFARAHSVRDHILGGESVAPIVAAERISRAHIWRPSCPLSSDSVEKLALASVIRL